MFFLNDEKSNGMNEKSVGASDGDGDDDDDGDSVGIAEGKRVSGKVGSGVIDGPGVLVGVFDRACESDREGAGDFVGF